MNEQILSYLKQVMHRSGLPRQERCEWIEEMSSHIYQEVSALMGNGCDETRAIALALGKFGTPSELRKKIGVQTFGLSSVAISRLTQLFFALFLVNFMVLQWWIYLGKDSQYNHTFSSAMGYIVDWSGALVMSPSLMIVLGLSFLTLYKTRCRTDRIAILVSLGLFAVLWTLMRLPMSQRANMVLFAFRFLWVGQPYESITDGILLIWGLVLYAWTGNRWLGIFPTLISIAIGAWVPIFTVTYNAWHHFSWNAVQALTSSLGLAIAVRSVPLILIWMFSKLLDVYRKRSDKVTIS